MQQHIDIDNRHLGIVEQVLVLGHDFLFKYLIDFRQFPNIESGIAVGAQKGHHKWLYGGMGCAVGIRRHAGIADINAGFNGFQVAHGRHAGGKMTVQVDGWFHCRL